MWGRGGRVKRRGYGEMKAGLQLARVGRLGHSKLEAAGGFDPVDAEEGQDAAEEFLEGAAFA